LTFSQKVLIFIRFLVIVLDRYVVVFALSLPPSPPAVPFDLTFDGDRDELGREEACVKMAGMPIVKIAVADAFFR
jgi:hypothetical protein